MNLPYIPPSSPGDRPEPKLVVLFLEAVARVTDAFSELRNTIYRKCEWRNDTGGLEHYPEGGLDKWLHDWHLDFENYKLPECAESIAAMVYTWTLQVLAWWHRKPEDREAPKPKVDCGWWEALKPPRRQLSSDAAMLAWNPDREPFETWTAGLAEMRRQRNTELKKYGAYPFEPQNPLAFEWLALSVCCGLSDGEIAKKYRTHQVPPEAVKKARRRLAKRLHILP